MQVLWATEPKKSPTRAPSSAPICARQKENLRASDGVGLEPLSPRAAQGPKRHAGLVARNLPTQDTQRVAFLCFGGGAPLSSTTNKGGHCFFGACSVLLCFSQQLEAMGSRGPNKLWGGWGSFQGELKGRVPGGSGAVGDTSWAYFGEGGPLTSTTKQDALRKPGMCQNFAGVPFRATSEWGRSKTHTPYPDKH